MNRRTLPAGILLAGTLIALSGCVSFGGKAPKVLLTLTPVTTVIAGTTRAATPAQTMVVLPIIAPASIATVRIPVYDGRSELSYVKDAAWNEMPARLFQRMLSETIAAKTSRVVIDFRQASLDPGTQLSGQLQKFGVDPQTMRAIVVYDGILRRSGNTVEARRFEASVPIGAIEGREVGRVLNQAANDVAAQIADWVK